MGEGIQRLGAMEELFGRDRLAEALRGKSPRDDHDAG